MTVFPRKVVCSAVVVTKNSGEEVTLVGIRHWDKFMRSQAFAFDCTKDCYREEKQGFLDQWGIYMSREEAMQVVIASGQPFDLERNCDDEILYSEGVW